MRPSRIIGSGFRGARATSCAAADDGPSDDTSAATGAAEPLGATGITWSGATDPTALDHHARCAESPEFPPSIRQRQLSS